MRLRRPPQWTASPRILQHIDRAAANASVSNRSTKQPVFSIADHLKSARYPYPEHHRAAAHRVHHAPGKHERHGQINVQIGSRQQQSQIGWNDRPQRSDSSEKIVRLLRQRPLL